MRIQRDVLGDVIAVLGGLMVVGAIGMASWPVAVFVGGVLLIVFGVLLNRPAA